MSSSSLLLVLALVLLWGGVGWSQTVQHSYTNASTSANPTLSVTISNSTAGDNLLLGISTNSALTGISGNCSTWTQIKTISSSFSLASYIYCGATCTGTAAVVGSFSGGYGSMTVYDVSGMTSCTANITSSDSGTAGTAIDAGSALTSTANTAGICAIQSVSATTESFTGAPGDSGGTWSNQKIFTSSNIATEEASQVVSATGTHTCTQTASIASISWTGVQAWFPGTAAGATGCRRDLLWSGCNVN